LVQSHSFSLWKKCAWTVLPVIGREVSTAWIACLNCTTILYAHTHTHHSSSSSSSNHTTISLSDRTAGNKLLDAGDRNLARLHSRRQGGRSGQVR
jgi:hypothetical protein